MQRNNRQKGFSLVELMVGVTIGLMAIFATYRAFENVERNYRAVETVNEAQMAGLYATFMVSHELGNAGAGVMSNFGLLQGCTAVPVFPNNDAGSPPFPLYPLPAAVIPTDDGWLDEIFVFYGTGSVTDSPVPVKTVDAPRHLSLVAPLGLAEGSVLVATARAACDVFVSQNVTPPDGSGRVDITVGAGQFLGSVSAGDSLIDLGNVARRRFFVDENATLQMELWKVDGDAGNNNWKVAGVVPIAANVIAFKAQYGVAATPDDPVSRWITPDATTLDQIMNGMSMEKASVENASLEIPSARNIKAIRFGLIVKASEPDTALAEASDTTETFFADCPSSGLCDDPLSFNLVVSQSGQPFGWRYRKYETTVPLQNTIWN